MGEDWDEDTVTDIAELRTRIERGSGRPCLTVITGASAGQVFKLPDTPATIGRGPTAKIRLDDDGVSRAHATFRHENGRVWIEDCASRNGTYVNGNKLEQSVALVEGDKVQIGRTTVLRFEYQDELDESFHEQLLASALRDPLTGLFNKRYFLDRLDRELRFARRHGTPLSLLMVDLDHFKAVNDTHGHLAGDAVLANLASTLTRAVRNEDVVARFGGEEIAIILRAIPLDPAIMLADRLCKLVEKTVTPYAGLELRATASIGAAGFPATSADTVEELINAADRALYKAKGQGRNRVRHSTLS
ncbi:MAG: GGDEF domain-containing protein [Kofleriaceae bacterium]|nr:GGDEF domain-containing protein [Kofleriaceae bacterium]